MECVSATTSFMTGPVQENGKADQVSRCASSISSLGMDSFKCAKRPRSGARRTRFTRDLPTKRIDELLDAAYNRFRQTSHVQCRSAFTVVELAQHAVMILHPVLSCHYDPTHFLSASRMGLSHASRIDRHPWA